MDFNCNSHIRIVTLMSLNGNSFNVITHDKARLASKQPCTITSRNLALERSYQASSILITCKNSDLLMALVFYARIMILTMVIVTFVK